MAGRKRLHLFKGFGIELEYMIVKKDTLEVLPVSDEVIRSAAGRYSNDTVLNGMGWSNEFVLHVIEMRNVEPVHSLSGLPARYQTEISRINAFLEPMGGVLMPSSMHPWMDPGTQTRLWHRRSHKIYETYDRIFNCNAHGWANIQSAQMNISFSGDREFRKLHTAIRLVLPLIPALSASSPVVEGRMNGVLDNRIFYYRMNQIKVPSITGDLIPEFVSTKAEYRDRILKRIYVDIAPHDNEGILQHEWLNSRGAIARFDRSAIEIRLPDIQECPVADMAVLSALAGAVKAHVEEKWIGFEEQAAWETGPLVSILDETARRAENTVIGNRAFLRAFGIEAKTMTAGEVWRHLHDTTLEADGKIAKALNTILEKGTLASRILKAAGKRPKDKDLREIYRDLCRCLSRGRMFSA